MVKWYEMQDLKEPVSQMAMNEVRYVAVFAAQRLRLLVRSPVGTHTSPPRPSLYQHVAEKTSAGELGGVWTLMWTVTNAHSLLIMLVPWAKASSA
jgi:hypothetical protein